MCVFCDIAQRRLPAYIVYEDESALAFLDSDPIAEGHMLLIPKTHYLDLDDMPEDLAAHLTRVARKLVAAMKRTYSPQGYGMMQNGGRFNDIGHFHLHIFLRNEGDGFSWTDGGAACAVNETVAHLIKQNMK